jgi:hypothetical protein
MFTDREKIAMALIAGIALAFAAKYFISISNEDPQQAFLFEETKKLA